MQQWQTYIPMVRFPNPNYGIKMVNYNKLPSPIVSSPSIPICVTQRSLSFMLVSPNASFYIPNWRNFNIDFRNKVMTNIQSQIPLSNIKSWGVFRILQKGNIILKLWSRQCDRGLVKVTKITSMFWKDNFYNVSFSRVFQRKYENIQ